MAVLERIKEQYVEHEDLDNLIAYVIRGSKAFYSQNLYNLGEDIYTPQFLYYQNCYARNLNTRAKHFVLSFDSHRWEQQIKYEELQDVVLLCLMPLFSDFQVVYGVHYIGKCWHVHMALNSVNKDGTKLHHWSLAEYYEFKRELAIRLYHVCGVALRNTSYIDSKGHLRFSQNETDLYQNRFSPDMPLMVEHQRINVNPYMPGMPICDL